MCLSHRKFPEVFETPPTFNSSHLQSGVIAKIPLSCVFFGTPCTIVNSQVLDLVQSSLCPISRNWTGADKIILGVTTPTRHTQLKLLKYSIIYTSSVSIRPSMPFHDHNLPSASITSYDLLLDPGLSSLGFCFASQSPC